MENLQTTTARLRRTFQYPDDSSYDSQEPNAMDEEEQEQLIQRLTEENTTRNTQFRRALLSLPAVSTIPYLPALFSTHTFFPAVLALTSLASTAFLLWRLPPGVTGITPLDRWTKPKTPPPRSPAQGAVGEEDDVDEGEDVGESAYAAGRRTARRSARRERLSERLSSQGRGMFERRDSRSPLERYLPYLNMGLCVALALLGMVAKLGEGVGGIGLGNLPGIVLILVLLAKVVMGGVDPEKELTALRYEFKGA